MSVASHISFFFCLFYFFFIIFFFFNDTATTEIYTLSLHDALPIFQAQEAYENSLKSLEELKEQQAVATLAYTQASVATA